jgi:NMD protein affecting ribosome stability and mRNA decay
MDVDLLQHLRPRRTLQSTKQPTGLVTCSLCLRVRRGSEWREAEQVIRELRSYELEAPPRLHSAVCEVCAESIFSRRVAEEIRVEAA